MTLVGAPPPVDQPKLALVDVVDDAGPLVSETEGAAGGGAVDESS